MTAYAQIMFALVSGWCVAACGFPRPLPLDLSDGGFDASASDADTGDGTQVDGATMDGNPTQPLCSANQVLRCDGANLVRCNSDGSAETTDSCAVGCNATMLRCNDVNPSNGLAPYLDMTASESDIDLGASAIINTDSGAVVVDGTTVVVKSVLLAQATGPMLRVLIVRSLTAAGVKVTGKNALAVVSDGVIKISGVFAASAVARTPGAGRLNDGTCTGGPQTTASFALGGSGGGGFGFAGGAGGTAISDSGTAGGGAGGTATGNATLIPLRGGCDGGAVGGDIGGGGGAIQLVSRALISITSVIAANGSSVNGGGGSGGGILLEAPSVDVAGAVVANGGGGGGGCAIARPGEDGRLDATPATRGLGCNGGSDGGRGGAGNFGADNGVSVTRTDGSLVAAGHGGGSVGRIRVNTAPGGLHTTGLFSPNPSTGAVGIR